MHILFTRFPLESARGGAENQTQWLMEGLRARGHDVEFLGSCPVLLERTRELKMENGKLEIGLPPVSKWLAISFLWRKAKMQTALIEGIQSLPEKPDAIFMLSLSEKLLLTEWADGQGIRVFWIEHDRVGPWLTRNPWLPALKKASRHATIVCVSELSRKMYEKIGFDPKNLVAIPNGVSSPLPYPPAPSPDGGRGASQAERDGWTKKKLVRPATLQFARDMRKAPTPAEKFLWKRLRFDQLGVRFRRQHPVGIRILDFYCHEARLGVEVDGPIHDQPEQEQDDRCRTESLEEIGIRILRFTNDEIFRDVEKVILKIKDNLRSPPPSGEGTGVGEVGVGVVARLSPEKGIDILLEAIADLPELSLTIVGTGPQESEICRLIAEDTERLGLGIPRIELKKTVSDLPAFYSSLDVFVLPSSDHDPFGLVAAEAMTCGTATIVTDACGIAGYVQDGVDALVVSAGSVSALRAGIRRLGDPELRHALGMCGRQIALERFSLGGMIDEYEKIL